MNKKGNKEEETNNDKHAWTTQGSKQYGLNGDFRDSELVIGLVGAVGTDLTLVESTLTSRLELAGYSVKTIHISKHVMDEIVPDRNLEARSKYEHMHAKMDRGDLARELSEDNGILSLGVAKCIFDDRDQGHKTDDASPSEPVPRRCWIIKSVKHPDEVRQLRHIYQRGFYLIGVNSPKDAQETRLEKVDGIKDEVDRQEIMKRDENEHLPHGQRLSDTFHLADFFVNTEGKTGDLAKSLLRILDILFGAPHETPTFDEYAMFLAFAASLRSADLSRQVGAVIAREREIIATGANDCPRFGGGLYWPEYNHDKGGYEDTEGGRDYKLGYDSNVRQRQAMIDEIVTLSAARKLSEEDLREVLGDSPIKDLTEFGRSVHAEMEALLCCARNTVSARGCTLYSTTFPCHNCGRHIIAAGIERVVYVEPYRKSKWAELHEDAVVCGLGQDVTSKIKKVQCEPFVGVGPRRFFDLFSMRLGSGPRLMRKNQDGDITDWEFGTSQLRLQMLPTSYLDLESGAATVYEEAIEVVKAKLEEIDRREPEDEKKEQEQRNS